MIANCPSRINVDI
ncbi:hypothetical protein D030_3427A, partial [Vibrio parahaemolyticus AQ3810]